MTRDLDLVRKILLFMEAAPTGYAPDTIEIDGYDQRTIGFHARLMIQAELIDGADITSFGDTTPRALALTITWKGYEFLDAARDATAWNRAKATARTAGNASFKVLFEVLTRLALGQIGP